MAHRLLTLLRRRNDAGHLILTITQDQGSGNGLVTTAAAHGLESGQTIIISGTSNPGYNGVPNEITDPTETTFIILYVGDSEGGTWELQ